MSNIKYMPEEPIVAIATSLSPAALGIVRCSGKNCVSLVSRIFSRKNALLSATGNTLVYGWIIDDEKKVDEVMVAVYRAPKSFTGEEMIEIFCHGGPGVVLAIHNLLLESGFREAERGEFTFRAFVNGKADLTKSEAVQEIIESRTGEARSRAAGRLAGNLFSEIDCIKTLIKETIAAIEVEIEYPEDEETIADSFDIHNLKEASKKLVALKDSWKGEKLYQDGARVVLCGRTNAGKSSLFNAILKEERAIVSDIEGTTRDWLESFCDIGGIPVRLFDTAGLRKTDDVVESQGVAISKNLSEDADIILYLADASLGLTEEDKAFIEHAKKPLVLVWNKCDKCTPNKETPQELNKYIKSAVCVSAKTTEGFYELYQAIQSILTEGISSECHYAGLGSARQKSIIDEAYVSVQHAMEAADTFTLDAVVQDLEDALNLLGEVTGEVTSDDILESIFSKFCVGK